MRAKSMAIVVVLSLAACSHVHGANCTGDFHSGGLCTDVNMSKCDSTYVDVGGDHAQCGILYGNCLTKGPFCTKKAVPKCDNPAKITDFAKYQTTCKHFDSNGNPTVDPHWGASNKKHGSTCWNVIEGTRSWGGNTGTHLLNKGYFVIEWPKDMVITGYRYWDGSAYWSYTGPFIDQDGEWVKPEIAAGQTAPTYEGNSPAHHPQHGSNPETKFAKDYLTRKFKFQVYTNRREANEVEVLGCST